MTLIVGMHCGDHLLLSADSGVYDDATGKVDEAVKLAHGGSFAWGFGGYEDLGDQFHNWMRAEHWRLSRLRDWQAALSEIQTIAGRINAERRMRMREAGVDLSGPLEWNNFLHSIVAGYVGSEGMVVSIDHEGALRRASTVSGSIVPVGVEAAAGGAYTFLKQKNRWANNQDSLDALMELAITNSRPDENLRFPVRMLRVDGEQVTEAVARRVVA